MSGEYTTFTGCQNRMTTIRNAADDSRGSQSDMACVEGCICIYINIINCAPSSKKAMHYTNRLTEPGNNVNHATKRRRDRMIYHRCRTDRRTRLH